MLDHHEGRIWADHHTAFSNSFGAIMTDVRLSFERLNARLYDAPWERDQKPPAH